MCAICYHGRPTFIAVNIMSALVEEEIRWCNNVFTQSSATLGIVRLRFCDHLRLGFHRSFDLYVSVQIVVSKYTKKCETFLQKQVL